MIPCVALVFGCLDGIPAYLPFPDFQNHPTRKVLVSRQLTAPIISPVITKTSSPHLPPFPSFLFIFAFSFSHFFHLPIPIYDTEKYASQARGSLPRETCSDTRLQNGYHECVQRHLWRQMGPGTMGQSRRWVVFIFSPLLPLPPSWFRVCTS